MSQNVEKSRTILVVDDEEAVRTLIADILKKKGGYAVLGAVDGQKGLEEARRKKPDLIILDVNMPRLDGFRVLELLKKDSRTMNIPVIMLTARAAEADMRQGLSLYAEKYLAKPFPVDALVSEIEKSFAVR